MIIGCRIRALAQADLELIWLYTGEKWGVNQADDYLSALIKRINRLAENPTILRLMRLGYEYLSLKDPKSTWDESTNIFHASIKRINPELSDIGAKQFFNDISLGCLLIS